MEASGRKRKFSEVAVPPSLTSYLWGLVSNDFRTVKELARMEHPGQFEGKQKHLDATLEEVFRYLLLVAVHSENVNVSSVSPSWIVDKVLHCLILDPTLYYKVCDAILTLISIPAAERPMRVLPHNPLGGQDANRDERYKTTLVLYKERFAMNAPGDIWNDGQYVPARGTLVHTPPGTSNTNAAVEPGQNPTKPARLATDSPQQSISLAVKAQTGEEMIFRVKRTTLLERIMNAYAERLGVAREDLRFTYGRGSLDGSRVDPAETPESLQLEDGDIIRVYLRMQGC